MTADVLEPVRLATPGKITAVIRPAGSAAHRVLASLFANAKEATEWPISARSGVCFVPEGAPLWNHRSASINARYLCLLSGRSAPSESQLVHSLRLAELPDDKIHVRASRLSRFERLSVWLAVHRLRQSHTLVVDDPTRGLTQSLVVQVVRLLGEAAAIPSAVIITTPDTSFAATVADRVVAQEQPWLE